MSEKTAVVITAFNGERWLRETLAAVFAQTDRPAEVVVVDDHSADASLEIVAEFPGVIAMTNTGKGVHSSRQIGFERTAAPYVAFLDQDDLWHPDHLRLLSGLLENHPDAPAAVGTPVHFTSSVELNIPPPIPSDLAYDPWTFFPICLFDSPSGVVFRRSALDEIGGWPQHHKGVSDYFVILALAVRAQLRHCSSTSYGRRVHPGGWSMALRRDNSHLNALIKAAEDAGEQRSVAQPAARQRLETRIEGLRLMRDVLDSVRTNDAAAFRAAALAWTAQLSDESSAFKNAVSGQLLWYLDPILEAGNPAEVYGVWRSLLDEWPEEAAFGRESVQSMAMRYPSGRSFVRPPRGTGKLFVFGGSEARKARLSRAVEILGMGMMGIELDPLRERDEALTPEVVHRLETFAGAYVTGRPDPATLRALDTRFPDSRYVFLSDSSFGDGDWHDTPLGEPGQKRILMKSSGPRSWKDLCALLDCSLPGESYPRRFALRRPGGWKRDVVRSNAGFQLLADVPESRLSGFHAPELYAGRILRWTKPDAGLTIELPHTGFVFTLRLAPIRRLTEGIRDSFQVKVDGITVPAAHVRMRGWTISFPVPGSSFDRTPSRALSFTVRNWDEAADDPRSLGLPLISIRWNT
jgi:hypothetical protein